MATVPVACTLSIDELQRDKRHLLPGLVELAVERQTRPDGIRLEFAPSPETITRLATVIDRERQCCRFLSFVLTVPADEGTLSLDISGPSGTAELLSALLSP